MVGFLSTLSLRRATWHLVERTSGQLDFYPRSPCGERRTLHYINLQKNYFYPRSPCGERRAANFSSGKSITISIHALLAESDLSNTVLFESPICISIHALLAESDRPPRSTLTAAIDFYPRSPCGERRRSAITTKNPTAFLSTLSLRRATISQSLVPSSRFAFLSTLSLRRATQLFRNL